MTDAGRLFDVPDDHPPVIRVRYPSVFDYFTACLKRFQGQYGADRRPAYIEVDRRSFWAYYYALKPDIRQRYSILGLPALKYRGRYYNALSWRDIPITCFEDYPLYQAER